MISALCWLPRGAACAAEEPADIAADISEGQLEDGRAGVSKRTFLLPGAPDLSLARPLLASACLLNKDVSSIMLFSTHRNCSKRRTGLAGGGSASEGSSADPDDTDTQAEVAQARAAAARLRSSAGASLT